MKLIYASLILFGLAILVRYIPALHGFAIAVPVSKDTHRAFALAAVLSWALSAIGLAFATWGFAHRLGGKHDVLP